MTGETIGWGGEFHLGDASNTPVEIIGVTELTVPEDTVDEVETTHFKSPGKRREYIGGLIAGGAFNVTMNYVPGSPTDVQCRGALRKVRSFKILLPDENGVPAWEITGNVLVTGYSRNIPLDDRLTAVLALRMTGDLTEGEA